MEGKIVLKYDGGQAAHGELDAYAAAEAIRSFADFSKSLSIALYGDDSKMRSSITASREGSHEIEFLLQLTEGAALIKSISDAFLGSRDFLGLVKDCFDLIKHLDGSPPKSIQKSEDGSVKVTNNHGTINIFNQSTLHVINQPPVTRAASGFVKRPLDKSATKLTITCDETIIASVDQTDSKSFVPLNCSDVLTTQISDTYLTISTAVLEGGNKWKFSNGEAKFFAEIEDRDFLEKVTSGQERFGKGDLLLVRLRSTQKRDQGKLRAEHVVEEVLEHVTNFDKQTSFREI